jgi:23S rRNA pseudouridine2605 synthase
VAVEGNQERLQRILASAGIASRRAAEQYILDGRVSVNGQTVDALGAKANPISDDIRVDGKSIRPQHLRYVMLNKPVGFITTMNDERGRASVMSLVSSPERIYPVGRLDRDTEGLLLLTNDGVVAHRVMHPSFGLEKEYEVLCPFLPPPTLLAKLRSGIRVDGKVVKPSEARLLRETSKGVVIRVTIHEGMTHVVRKMLTAVQIPIIALRRTRIGPLNVAGIAIGEHRDLKPGERLSLFEALKIDEPARSYDKPSGREPVPRAQKTRVPSPEGEGR